jgi:hypothetical protein
MISIAALSQKIEMTINRLEEKLTGIISKRPGDSSLVKKPLISAIFFSLVSYSPCRNGIFVLNVQIVGEVNLM